MTLEPGKAEQLAKAVTMGKSRDDYASTPSELEYWDQLVKEIAVIHKNGGVVDIPWDDAGTPDDYLAYLYRDD